MGNWVSDILGRSERIIVVREWSSVRRIYENPKGARSAGGGKLSLRRRGVRWSLCSMSGGVCKCFSVDLRKDMKVGECLTCQVRSRQACL